MCLGIEYLLDGQAKTVYFDSHAPTLPVRVRGGAIRFYTWGTRSAAYVAADNIPGWGAKFPETGWIALVDINAGKWERLQPRPVRIVASRFLLLDRWQVPHYFSLAAGEFIQGALARIDPHERLYVVTVPAPAEHGELWPAWPRVISVSNRRRGALQR